MYQILFGSISIVSYLFYYYYIPEKEVFRYICVNLYVHGAQGWTIQTVFPPHDQSLPWLWVF